MRPATRVSLSTGAWLAGLALATATLSTACEESSPPRASPSAATDTASSAGGGGEGGSAGSAGEGGGEGGLGGGVLGPEDCFDAFDNDGNSDLDCDDETCAEACAESCVNAVVLDEPAMVKGLTTGHANDLHGSCVAESGAEVVYRVTAKSFGVLDVRLSSSAALGLSVRAVCDDVNSELGCADRVQGGVLELLTVPVDLGEELYVVVDGSSASDAGLYTLEVASRPIACGDAHTDAPEACDDGGNADGDGCSATCQIESSESEPNETVGQPDPYVGLHHAAIDPSGDIDVVSVSVPGPASKIEAKIFDFGDGACAAHLRDTYIEILGPEGETIEADDDGGAGFCSSAIATQLPAGTYFVRVQAAVGASPSTFGYVLDVVVSDS